MKQNSGLTRLDVINLVVAAALLALLAALLSPVRGHRGDARRIRCRSNLSQLGSGVAAYVAEFGDNRWLPFPLDRRRVPHDFNGAEWLASLYWTGVVEEPQVFICPASGDTNREGADLGTHHAIPGRFGPRTVSYAGLHYYSRTDASGNPRPCALINDLAPSEPIASDDTQGAVNHGTSDSGGMCVRFFDSHVEWKTHEEIDLKRGVGQKGGLLWRLRN